MWTTSSLSYFSRASRAFFSSSSSLQVLSSDPNYKFFVGGILERLPRVARKAPSWKEEKAEFQTRVENQKMKILGFKPTVSVIDAVEEAIAWNGVYNRTSLTKADKENNRRSLHRKMDSRLFYIVKKANTLFEWQFPFVEWKAGEKLRDTAERSSLVHVPQFSVYYLSNSPDAHHDFSGDKKIHRIFLYRGYHVNGKPSVGDEVIDYAWVTKDELAEYLEPAFYNSVKNILQDC
jgi:hypothetical protein